MSDHPPAPALEAIADAVWTAEGEVVDFYSFPYPTRMAVVRLAGDGLWVWSPTALTPAVRERVESLGVVSHLVSPNKLHHLYLADWKAAWPEAKLWGPRSTVSKVKALAFQPPLTDRPPPDWPEIDQAWIKGSPFLDEIVFFHRPSRTTFVCDALQHFDDAFLRQHWGWRRPLAYLDGVACGTAPLEWRLSMLDRAAAEAAYAKITAWNCERVVIAHGACIERDGAEALRRGLQWLA